MNEEEKSPEPNSREDFMGRFRALQKEARSYGIVSIVVLEEDDMLSQQSVATYGYECSPAHAMGLMEYAKHVLMENYDR